ncbi:MAG: CDP-diacylglycerol--glycerol-3-phosphate 3-phosphatidyltransferase [Jatrophihabitans sp.]|uniref:CDP-diacylglycerol--glycerol-3-phosphate 3-phosphatidyltransferase n=1 Tax=Jatrophihabitans sp. TaxID=1932789 RepID=UPI003F818097
MTAAERKPPRALAPEADHLADATTSVSAWNLPNALTVFRLLLVPVFVVVLFHGSGHERGWRVLAWGVFALAAVTDRLDGDIARKRGLVTEFGKLVDPIADKALIGASLIGLSILHELPWWITVLILARELGVTLLRFWVIRHGVIPASRGGKLKTLLQDVGIGLFVLPLTGLLHALAWVFMVAAIIVTVITGIDYVFRAVNLRRMSLAGAGAPDTPTVPSQVAPPAQPSV